MYKRQGIPRGAADGAHDGAAFLVRGHKQGRAVVLQRLLLKLVDQRGKLLRILIVSCEKNDVDVYKRQPQTLAYEALLPFQVLSAVVSAAKGIECDKPRYPDFYAALNTKIDAGK